MRILSIEPHGEHHLAVDLHADVVDFGDAKRRREDRRVQGRTHGVACRARPTVAVNSCIDDVPRSPTRRHRRDATPS